MRRSYEHRLSLRFRNNCGDSWLFRTFCNFATGQGEKKQTEHEVETGESNQRENRVTVADDFTVAIAGVKQSVDQPRLASQFGRHPTERVGDVGIRKRQ